MWQEFVRCLISLAILCQFTLLLTGAVALLELGLRRFMVPIPQAILV